MNKAKTLLPLTISVMLACGSAVAAGGPGGEIDYSAYQDKPAPNLKAEEKINGFPASMQPWRVPGEPNLIKRDTDWEGTYKRRDLDKINPKREPGPIDLQRYEYVTTKHGFPTYFGLPVALNTEDLKAGDVDVAIVGLPSNFNMGGDGTAWAANQLRFVRQYDFAGVGHDLVLNNHYFDILNVVDYGNANSHVSFMNDNFVEHAKVLREIFEGGATPIAIGGEHGTQVASIMAVVDHYGPKEVAFVHFDAHMDYSTAGAGTLGLFTHGGRARRFAHENGWIDGADMHSIGIRGAYDDAERVEYLNAAGDKIHYMSEFERKGFEATWKKVREELKGKKLYISVDVDVLDAPYVPGTSNPEAGGFTSAQMGRMLRELAMQNDVVLLDFAEYTPLMDDNHYNTANTINRMMRAFLAGKAARKEGNTDPDYIHPAIKQTYADQK
ncbi:arginase family protein [Paraferrimonas sedimenticola]|uniref:Agmatinase n=1 Tax=Paraferrimonas sedimenticola TaxID=375674 RepID=A0AA37RW45_9GAMM|nr:arginase family protein [Paraferrimonas sedimenticola]GLP96044.1 agmatinase [Paraferrimonas sedimenticola]